MKVWTTRSGQILHATNSCPTLERITRIITLDDRDALPVAAWCELPLCRLVRARREAKAA